MKKVNSWKELTLREKIGQTVVCLCETPKHIDMCGSVEKFLEKYPIGGLYNYGGMVKGLLVEPDRNFRNVVDTYNQHLRVPLLTTGDDCLFAAQFGISLPPQMALGAADDEALAYAAGEFKAEDFKNTGIAWGFWPECDLNLSKHSPITDRRAIGDDWAQTTKLVKQEIKAMKDRGVIATLKHYPGGPYNEYVDPHLAPVDNETPVDLWWKTYGNMYRSLIEAGVPTIMTAHGNLVNYQTVKENGVFPPATMSYELTTKLLREELGFQGVTITDALVMGGFCGADAVDNLIKSFLAGNDVLLWPAYEYIDEMERRILSGEIDEGLLDAAVERIWNLKKEYGIIDNCPAQTETDAQFFADRAQQLAEKSLTLVQNDFGVLPLVSNKVHNVLVIGVTPDDGEYQELCALQEAFADRGCHVTIQRNIWTDELQNNSSKYDLIIFALCRSHHKPIGPLDFWGEEATSIWTSNCSPKEKTIVASFGTPYLYRYYKNSKMTYINAYSPQKEVIIAFVRAIFGEISFDGTSSVQLLETH